MSSCCYLQRIHSYPQNKNAQKALIAAEYAGLTIEEPAFEYGVTNKTAEFKKLTPIGKVPAPVACSCFTLLLPVTAPFLGHCFRPDSFFRNGQETVLTQVSGRQGTGVRVS